ncbi:hypothetical protein [Glycomyces arizonensis]|uniref:hypothetical protein n=1 Tax=Glycomyces arizonensis TaxID=256035 RepID=UPI0003FF3334|nr:hypothetical protein [Glycomyces arizonensis]
MYQAQAVPPQPAHPPAPPRKPASVALVQTAVFIPAIATPALIVLMLQRLVDLIEARRQWDSMGLEMIEAGTTPMDLATSEFLGAFSVLIALPVVLAFLAVLSAVGLHRRRRWARVLTVIRSSVLLLPLAAWAVGCQILVLAVAKPTAEDYYIGPIDPFTLNAIAATTAFVAELLVFILVLTRPSRRWAPKRSAAAVPGGQWPPAPMPQPSYPSRY